AADCPASARPLAPHWLMPTPWPQPPPSKSKLVWVLCAAAMCAAPATTNVAARATAPAMAVTRRGNLGIEVFPRCGLGRPPGATLGPGRGRVAVAPEPAVARF